MDITTMRIVATLGLQGPQQVPVRWGSPAALRARL